MSNNLDMKQLMNMLSKMDKNELQANIQKANQILNSDKKEDILNQIKNSDLNK